MFKVEQTRFLQVPGWEHLTTPGVKPVKCSCNLINGYVINNKNNNNNNSNSINKNINNNASNSSCSSLAMTNNGRCCCDIDANDKYTAAIELSNKCREFYQSRLEAANSIKSRWRIEPSDKLSTENSYPYSPQTKHQSQKSASLSSFSSSTSSSESLSASSSTSSLSACSSGVSNKDSSAQFGKARRTNSIDLAMNRLRTEMVSIYF
ncbi:hypothetical protein EGW08_001320, partial [Elysia chlorotica]